MISTLWYRWQFLLVKLLSSTARFLLPVQAKNIYAEKPAAMKIVSNRNGIKRQIKYHNSFGGYSAHAHTQTPTHIRTRTGSEDRINKIKWWSMYIMDSEKCYFGITPYGNDHKAGIRNYYISLAASCEAKL